VNERGGPAEVVFVLLAMQAAAGLLAGTGELLFMGSPLYAAVPVLKAVMLLGLATSILRGRRWAMIVIIVVEWLGLLGCWLGVVLALLPGFAPAITLTLLTQVLLPATVIVLLARCGVRKAVPAHRQLLPALR
jgi:hypothetical protein